MSGEQPIAPSAPFAAQPPPLPVMSAPSSNGTVPHTGRKLHRRVRRWILRSAVAALILIITAVFAGIMLARTPPSWWRIIDANSKPVQEAAQRVENGAATQLTRIRKSDPGGAGNPADSKPWTIKLTAADANAWLAARLRPWLESQEGAAFRWPADLDRVQVDFDAGRINLGASVRSPGRSGPEIFTASLLPEFRSDGGLWLPAQSVSIGRLSMPVSWMISDSTLKKAAAATTAAAPKAAPQPAVPDSVTSLPQTRDLLAALADQRPMMQSPIIKIGDGRRVRILKLDPRDGALYITCQTLGQIPERDRGAARKPLPHANATLP